MTTTETSYVTHDIQIKNTKWNVLVVSGRYNYISVKKVTANPYGVLGKDFKNFDEAISHYKNPQMKVELLKIELGL